MKLILFNAKDETQELHNLPIYLIILEIIVSNIWSKYYSWQV